MNWESDMPREVRLLAAIKRAGEDVISDRHAMIEVDKRRQKLREGSRALEKISEDKVTLMPGTVMIELRKEVALNIIKNDLKELDIESNRLRSELKGKLSLLHELEMKDPIRGLDLEALSQPEMAAVGQVLGRTSST